MSQLSSCSKPLICFLLHYDNIWLFIRTVVEGTWFLRCLLAKVRYWLDELPWDRIACLSLLQLHLLHRIHFIVASWSNEVFLSPEQIKQRTTCRNVNLQLYISYYHDIIICHVSLNVSLEGAGNACYRVIKLQLALDPALT